MTYGKPIARTVRYGAVVIRIEAEAAYPNGTGRAVYSLRTTPTVRRVLEALVAAELEAASIEQEEAERVAAEVLGERSRAGLYVPEDDAPKGKPTP